MPVKQPAPGQKSRNYTLKPHAPAPAPAAALPDPLKQTFTLQDEDMPF